MNDENRNFLRIIAVLTIILFSCNRDDANNGYGGKGVYHNDDKEALRVFLQQPSAASGKINAELVGLSISDVNGWNNKDNENWVEKIAGLTWNNEIPKRLIEADFSSPMNPDMLVNHDLPFWLRLAGRLDASKWTRLNSLKIFATQITSINISSNTALTHLSLSKNDLISEINISENTALTHLSLDENPISELNINANTALVNLYLEDNPISELNVSANTALETLRCRFLQLTALDVSKNTALSLLDCSGNQLTELDVSRNTSLTRLSFGGNHLTELDVSRNLLLESLYCVENHLTEIDITANTELSSLHCYHNHLSLAKLFVISENWKYLYDSPPHLGSQRLKTLTVSVGSEIDYSDQLIFKDIETVFTVTKDGLPASESDYKLTDGKLTINSTGLYVVKMTNDAINSFITYDAVVSVEITVK